MYGQKRALVGCKYDNIKGDMRQEEVKGER